MSVSRQSLALEQRVHSTGVAGKCHSTRHYPLHNRGKCIFPRYYFASASNIIWCQMLMVISSWQFRSKKKLL